MHKIEGSVPTNMLRKNLTHLNRIYMLKIGHLFTSLQLGKLPAPRNIQNKNMCGLLHVCRRYIHPKEKDW